jgi:antiphage defense system Thoeris ThsB-like protein
MEGVMARHVFFSFHYQRDVWRINQIRNLGEVVGNAAAGFHDKSLWEEAKTRGDAVVQRMIDSALHGTSVTVVFIGSQTSGRKFINYEIEKSIARGNGLIGVQINGLKDKHGNSDLLGHTPALLVQNRTPIYKYFDSATLKKRIEEAAAAAGK